MFIKSFQVRNFKSHKETSVQLFPITVLVGSNNSGKSALFDALINFSILSRGRISEAFGHWPYSFDSIRYRGAGRAERIAYEVTMSETPDADDALQYEIECSAVGSTDNPTFVIQHETLVKLPKGTVVFDRRHPAKCNIPGVHKHISEDSSFFAAVRNAQIVKEYKETDHLVTHCARHISRINRFRLDPRQLERPGRIPNITPEESVQVPFLDHRGEDLASVLYYLSETKNPLLNTIQQKISDVIDGFECFQFNRLASGDRIGLLVRFTDSREVVPAVHISDGTLSLIGLITLLCTPARPTVLCLEEPENGLTPTATEAVYKAAKALATHSEGDKRSQILISSHSPFVICNAWNGDERDYIYQVGLLAGTTRVRPFKDAIEEYGTGLRKGPDRRREIGLKAAELVMNGYK